MAEEKATNVPKKYKRKHMWWRYLLVFVGGVLFTAVGAAAGAAVYSTTVPVSKVAELFPEEVRQYLTYFSENEQDTLYSQVMKFVTDPENTLKEFLSTIEVGDIITPEMVGEKLYVKLCYYTDDQTAPVSEAKINYEFAPLTQNEVTVPDTDKPINLYMLINGKIPDGKGGTCDFVTNLMNRLTLSDVMTVPDDSPLKALSEIPINNIASKIEELTLGELFGNEGIMAAIGHLTINDLLSNDVTEKIFIADVLGVKYEDAEGIQKTVCFDEDGNKRSLSALGNLEDEILNCKLVDIFPDASGDLINSIGGLTLKQLTSPDATSLIYLCDVLGCTQDSTDKLTKLLCFEKDGDGNLDYTKKRTIADIADVQSIFNTLLIEDVLDIDGTSDPILLAIKGTSLGDLSTKLGALKIGDVFPTSSSPLINWLRDEGGNPKVTDIDDAVMIVPLGKVINVDGLSGIAGGIFGELKDTAIGDLGTAMNNVLITKALASEIYDDSHNMKNEWKFMLYENIKGVEADQIANAETYKLSQFSQLIINMKYNMNHATLKDLQKAELIDGTLDLTGTLPGQSKPIGDMTIAELISAIVVYAS